MRQGFPRVTACFAIAVFACGGGHSSQPDAPPAPPDASLPGPTLSAQPGQNEAHVTWTAVDGATSYNVYRSNAQGTQGDLLINVSATQLDDTTLTNFEPEWYSVTGVVSGSGETAPSNQANAFGYDLSHWTVRREAFPLTGFAYAQATQTVSGKAIYVAVGWGGVVLTSNDGAAWTVGPQLPVFRFDAVTFGNGLFVAVGLTLGATTQSVYTSPDGLTWTQYNSGAAVELTAATYAVTDTLGTLYPVYIVVGLDGVIVTSPDGITWTARSCGGSSFYTVAAVTHSNMFSSSFAAIASGGGTACYSTDGVTWTPITLTGPLATAGFVTSIGDNSTGSVWMVDYRGLVYQQPYNFTSHALGTAATASLPSTTEYYGVTSYVDAATTRHIVAAGVDGTLVDTTAAAPGGFTQLAAALPAPLESTSAFAGISTVGSSLFVITKNEQILRSDDGGGTLTAVRDDPGGTNISAVARGALTVIDQGYGAIMSSTDNATFSIGTTGAGMYSTFPLVATPSGVSLVYTDTLNDALQIYESVDAQTWTQTTAPLALCTGCMPFDEGWVVPTDNGGYLVSMIESNAGTTALGVKGSSAVGFTTSLQSPNIAFTQTWEVGNTFYGLTNDELPPKISAIMESADGVTWTTITQFPATFDGQYYFDDGATKYVVDYYGMYTSSIDGGVTWSTPAVLDPGGRTITRLVRLGDHLIAVGAGGLITASLDGAHWTPIAPQIATTYYDIVVTDRGVALVGQSDVVLTAP